MQLGYGPEGKPYVSRYEVGDLVRLRVNESGDHAMGKAGQWGSVTAVEDRPGGRLDIQLAGYSEGKTSALQRLTGIPRSIVIPCQPNGTPLELPGRYRHRDQGRAGYRPSGPQANQSVVVNTAVAPATALPAWAASLVVAGCTLILVVAAGIAAKNFGLL